MQHVRYGVGFLGALLYCAGIIMTQPGLPKSMTWLAWLPLIGYACLVAAPFLIAWAVMHQPRSGATSTKPQNQPNRT